MVTNVEVFMKRLREDAIMPTYAHGVEDSGMDVFAAAIAVKENGEWVEYENTCIKPNQTVLVKTGFAAAIPAGTEFQARPTSGNRSFSKNWYSSCQCARNNRFWI